MISIQEAAHRIERSEGAAALCEIVDPSVGTVGQSTVQDFRARVGLGVSQVAEFRIHRTLRNWEIKRGAVTVARACPWDTTPNVARFVGAEAPVAPNLRPFADKLRELATGFERARLFPEAYAVCALEVQFLSRHKLDPRNAESEKIRIGRVLGAR